MILVVQIILLVVACVSGGNSGMVRIRSVVHLTEIRKQRSNCLVAYLQCCVVITIVRPFPRMQVIRLCRTLGIALHAVGAATRIVVANATYRIEVHLAHVDVREVMTLYLVAGNCRICGRGHRFLANAIQVVLAPHLEGLDRAEIGILKAVERNGLRVGVGIDARAPLHVLPRVHFDGAQIVDAHLAQLRLGQHEAAVSLQQIGFHNAAVRRLQVKRKRLLQGHAVARLIIGNINPAHRGLKRHGNGRALGVIDDLAIAGQDDRASIPYGKLLQQPSADGHLRGMEAYPVIRRLPASVLHNARRPRKRRLHLQVNVVKG